MRGRELRRRGQCRGQIGGRTEGHSLDPKFPSLLKYPAQPPAHLNTEVTSTLKPSEGSALFCLMLVEVNEPAMLQREAMSLFHICLKNTAGTEHTRNGQQRLSRHASREFKICSGKACIALAHRAGPLLQVIVISVVRCTFTWTAARHN